MRGEGSWEQIHMYKYDMAMMTKITGNDGIGVGR